MGTRRTQRVASAIQRELAQILLTEARDPVLGNVQITGVRATPDLQVAHIYYTAWTGDRDEIAHALERAQAFLRTAIAKRIQLRRSPELRFHFDDSLDRGQEMETLIERLREEGELGGESEDGVPTGDEEPDEDE